MTTLKHIFWNPQEQRLRFLWRLLIFSLLFAAVVTVVQPAILFLFPGLEDMKALATDVGFIKNAAIGEWGMALSLMLVLVVIGRWVDKRPWADYGFHFSRRWWLDLLFGLALGAVLMTGIFLTEWQLGWVEITSTFKSLDHLPFAVSILWPVALFIAVGIFEETLTRGYLLTNLAEMLNARFWSRRTALVLAWLISSALFGVAHAGNPNATVVSTLNIVVAGLLLGLGFVLTGDLAISIGLHITWNFFQGNVFGFPVSGTRTNKTSFITVAQHGPDAWTGGAFGPEAGIIGLIAIGAGALLLLAWVKWRYGAVRWQESIATPPGVR